MKYSVSISLLKFHKIPYKFACSLHLPQKNPPTLHGFYKSLTPLWFHSAEKTGILCIVRTTKPNLKMKQEMELQ